MASLVACAYILIVAAVFMRRMPSTRRVLWGFIVSAGVLGVVQCTAAFVLNLNCLDDGDNETSSRGDGMITPWQQVAVVVRIWVRSASSLPFCFVFHRQKNRQHMIFLCG